jgi:hypothetical protein
MHRVANSRRDREAGPEGKREAGSQRLLGDNHTRRLGDQMHWAKHHKSNDEVDLMSQQNFLSHFVGVATCSNIVVGNSWWIIQ